MYALWCAEIKQDTSRHKTCWRASKKHPNISANVNEHEELAGVPWLQSHFQFKEVHGCFEDRKFIGRAEVKMLLPCDDDKSAEIFTAQSFLLQTFGYITTPLSSPVIHWRVRLIRALQTLVSGGLLLTTICLLFLEIVADVFYSMFGNIEGKNADDPFIVRIISDLQYCFYPMRAVLVLMIFVASQSKWKDLQKNIHDFIRSNKLFSETTQQKLVQQIKTGSFLLFLVTLVVHVTFVLFQSGVTFIEKHQFHNPSYSVTERDYCYLVFCFNFIEYIGVWCMTAVPAFFLSQQVIISAVIFAFILLQTLRMLEKEIQDEVDHALSELNSIGMESWSSRLYRKVIRWTRMYTAAQKMLDSLNDMFTWILLVSIGCDLLTAISLGLKLIQPHANLSMIKAMYIIAGCALFIAYTTLQFLPFALLHQRVLYRWCYMSVLFVYHSTHPYNLHFLIWWRDWISTWVPHSLSGNRWFGSITVLIWTKALVSLFSRKPIIGYRQSLESV